jgi:hypothetical protein
VLCLFYVQKCGFSVRKDEGFIDVVGGQLNALEISQLSAFKTGHSIDLTLSAD